MPRLIRGLFRAVRRDPVMPAPAAASLSSASGPEQDSGAVQIGLSQDGSSIFVLRPGDSAAIQIPVTPDAAAPTYITVDSGGHVMADFSGHVHAQGLDLDAGTTSSPPADNRVRWLRTTSGAVVAELFGYNDGGLDGSYWQVADSDDPGTPGPSAALDLRADDTGNVASIGATIAKAGVGAVRRTVLDQDEKSMFAQLSGALARGVIALGTTTLTYPGASSLTTAKAIAHGLVDPSGAGVAPRVVLISDNDSTDVNHCSAYSAGAVNFTARAQRVDGASPVAGTNINIGWLAVA